MLSLSIIIEVNTGSSDTDLAENMKGNGETNWDDEFDFEDQQPEHRLPLPVEQQLCNEEPESQAEHSGRVYFRFRLPTWTDG